MTDFFKFIGEDGSMGFENGKIYLLTISDWYRNDKRVLAVINSIPHTTNYVLGDYYPYESCEAFFNNWERVK